MKKVVIVDDAKDAAIHPKKMMETFTRLLQKDVQSFLRRRPALQHVSCPGCGGQKREVAFKKLGFTYQRCKTCLTMYMSPRPSADALRNFHETSKAMAYSNSDFIRQTSDTREAHIFIPRVDWLSSVVRSRLTAPISFADIQPKYPSLLKRISELRLFDRLYALEVSASLTPSLEKLGYTSLGGERPSSNGQKTPVNVATAFEVIERVHDAHSFISSLNHLMPADGLLFLTTRAGSGFDVQVLWEHTHNIFPIIHMNLLSVEGIQSLLKRGGFDILELSTPGRLDVEIVRETRRTDKHVSLPRFISYLIEHRDMAAHEAFQEFLQQYQLSSHLRVVARRRSL